MIRFVISVYNSFKNINVQFCFTLSQIIHVMLPSAESSKNGPPDPAVSLLQPSIFCYLCSGIEIYLIILLKFTLLIEVAPYSCRSGQKQRVNECTPRYKCTKPEESVGGRAESGRRAGGCGSPCVLMQYGQQWPVCSLPRLQP